MRCWYFVVLLLVVLVVGKNEFKPEFQDVFVSLHKTELHRELHIAKSLKDVVTSLRQHAERGFNAIRSIVNQMHVTVRPTMKMFWITNEVYLSRAPAFLVRVIRKLSFVAEVRMYEPAILHDVLFVLKIPGLIKNSTENDDENCVIDDSDETNQPWAPETIGAIDLWKQNVTGQDVIVASIDSGARQSHFAIRDQFVGKYGWHDPINNTDTPHDPFGHGTRVIGAMVGSNGIGVAPQAKWIACRACTSDKKCERKHLLQCAQYLTCPTGDAENCGPVPRVIVNSWYNEDNFESAILAWKKAGIVAVFAAGNTGPSCSTIREPADLDGVLTVGASLPWDDITEFSSRGPTRQGKIKPDLVAPGLSIVTPASTGDCDMEMSSGTSIAAPIVAGSVALLLQVFPNLSLDDIRRILLESASKYLQPLETAKTCGGISHDTLPNNLFGHGRLDIARAVNMLRENENLFAITRHTP